MASEDPAWVQRLDVGDIKSPMLPNFVHVENPTGVDPVSIPIRMLTEKQIKELGGRMARELVEHWAKKREVDRG